MSISETFKRDLIKKSGHNIKVPFAPGRGDASQEQTDTYSFSLLEPKLMVLEIILQKKLMALQKNQQYQQKKC